MNREQIIAAIVAYFVGGQGSAIPYEHDGVTRPAQQWFQLPVGAAGLIATLIDDLDIGKSLGLKVTADSVDANMLRRAIAEGDEFTTLMGTDTREKLNWIMGTGTFDMSDTSLVLKAEEFLLPYPSCLARFRVMKLRDATINEARFGGAATIDHINQAIVDAPAWVS